jgi:hypothetical protein
MSRSAVELCTRETIEIRWTKDSIRKIPSWRYGELAAILPPHIPRWVIVIVPTGTVLSPDLLVFKDVEDACGAMLKLSTIVNSWALVQPGKVDPELWLNIRTIGIKFNTDPRGLLLTSSGLTKGETAPNLNNYREEDFK